jgi:uncharacterized protein (DUF4415 family)
MKRKSRTDWKRVRRMTQAEADQAAAQDPENPPLTAKQLDQLVVVWPDRKEAVSIRLDRRVLDFFRKQGPGYQSRINAVLRAFVERQQKRRAS